MAKVVIVATLIYQIGMAVAMLAAAVIAIRQRRRTGAPLADSSGMDAGGAVGFQERALSGAALRGAAADSIRQLHEQAEGFQQQPAAEDASDVGHLDRRALGP